MSVPSTATAQTDLALIAGHPLFGALQQAQLQRLVAYAKHRRIRAGRVIFAKGDRGDALFAIRAGTIKITAPAGDGREAVFNILAEGEIFGEIALLDGQSRTADAVAVTDSDLLVIERRDFLALVESDPKIALKLIELLCTRLRWSSEHFEEVVLLKLPARLARTLLRLIKGKPADGGEIELRITQRELSQILGTTRERINRELSVWTARKWIALTRGRIVVRSVRALEKIAEQPGAG
jgi:CRP/FNR family transcriptional regulator, cyclic AMP receptor protein